MRHVDSTRCVAAPWFTPSSTCAQEPRSHLLSLVYPSFFSFLDEMCLRMRCSSSSVPSVHPLPHYLLTFLTRASQADLLDDMCYAAEQLRADKCEPEQSEVWAQVGAGAGCELRALRVNAFTPTHTF